MKLFKIIPNHFFFILIHMLLYFVLHSKVRVWLTYSLRIVPIQTPILLPIQNVTPRVPLKKRQGRVGVAMDWLGKQEVGSAYLTSFSSLTASVRIIILRFRICW